MALQLTLSCDLDKSQSGPTLIHSTGVQDYKIPPEVVSESEISIRLRSILSIQIRTLQENISNDLLSDHSEGVLCQEGPQRVLAVLRQNGFTLQKQTTDSNRALWTLVQSGGGSSGSGGGGGHHPVPPPAPQPTPGDDNDADAGQEDEGEGGEGEEGEGEGEEEETEEQNSKGKKNINFNMT